MGARIPGNADLNLIQLLLVFALALSAGACGSKGGSGVASEASAGIVDEGPCGEMDEDECAMVEAINVARTQNGLAPLGILSKCVAAAGAHAEDMIARNYFSHNAPDETWSQRMVRFQLNGASIAENIASGNTSVSRTVDQWVNSPGHYANILGANYKSTGVGTATNATGRRVWVQCFSGYSPD